ncbi:MAG TPA: NAD(P)H-dependent oxidoreductase [Trueperaceae bacterium]|nr:NAD(P)H-dependent oxidoreductase [Trueperaceae bacterium]
MSKAVAVLIGSLRAESLNRRLALALERHAPADWTFTHLDLGGLPLYNEDLQPSERTGVAALKEAIAGAAALLIVSPEYNRSMPGVLKNAIDWASRPPAENAFAGKPTLIAGASTGRIGTAVMQGHLRTSLAYLQALPMGQPELYLTFQPRDLIDERGVVTVSSTDALLADAMSRFAAWVEKLTSK